MSRTRPRKWSAAEVDILKSMYQTHTRQEIAAKLGRTEGSVRQCCWAIGLNTKHDKWTTQDLDALIRHYENIPRGPLNLRSLSDALGRTEANICRKARQLGLTNPRRAKLLTPKIRMTWNSPEYKRHMSSTTIQWQQKNVHPRGALGMKHTEETKKVISEASKRSWRSKTAEQQGDIIVKAMKTRVANGIQRNPHGSWNAGWREISDRRIYFRSMWEANYARYLEWLRSIGNIKSWDHEPETFWFEGVKRGCVSYLPDFKVVNADGSVEYHEVKGWMDDRSRTKIARMAKYHPDIKLVVIDSTGYQKLAGQISKAIPGWESDKKRRK